MLQEIIIEPLCNELHNEGYFPQYNSEEDVGFDVFALKDIILAPEQSYLFNLGFKMKIPLHPRYKEGYQWICQSMFNHNFLAVSLANEIINHFCEDEISLNVRNINNYKYFLSDEMRSGTIAIHHYSGGTTYLKLSKKYTNVIETIDGNKIFTSKIPHQSFYLSGILGSSNVPDGSIYIPKGSKIAQLTFVEIIRPFKFLKKE